MALPISYNVRNVIVRWKVTLLALSGIAMVVGVLIALTAMANGFSKALAAKYGLSNYEAIKLAYDDADRLMVLRFLPEKLPGSVPIKQRDALVIPAKSFVRHFGIPTGQYEAHWDDKDKSLTCIHINPAQEAA